MPSGRPKEISFTPAVNGAVRVRCTFDMEWRGGSTASAYATVFKEQGGTTVYSPYEARVPRYTRQSCVVEDTFTVTAGSLVKVGLYAWVGTIGGITTRNIKVQALFVPT